MCNIRQAVRVQSYRMGPHLWGTWHSLGPGSWPWHQSQASARGGFEKLSDTVLSEKSPAESATPILFFFFFFICPKSLPHPQSRAAHSSSSSRQLRTPGPATPQKSQCADVGVFVSVCTDRARAPCSGFKKSYTTMSGRTHSLTFLLLLLHHPANQPTKPPTPTSSAVFKATSLLLQHSHASLPKSPPTPPIAQPILPPSSILSSHPGALGLRGVHMFLVAGVNIID